MPRTNLHSRWPILLPCAIGCSREKKVRRPPAVAGQHGDVATFQACCRLVRGFRLADDDALSILQDWNAFCQPPWTEHELTAKLRHARRYGREPLGGLLGSIVRSESWKQ